MMPTTYRDEVRRLSPLDTYEGLREAAADAQPAPRWKHYQAWAEWTLVALLAVLLVYGVLR